MSNVFDVPDQSEGVNLLSICCSSGTCRLWSFSWTTTRESRLKSMPVMTVSRPASSWANLSWHGNTMHQRRWDESRGFRWEQPSLDVLFQSFMSVYLSLRSKRSCCSWQTRGKIWLTSGRTDGSGLDWVSMMGNGSKTLVLSTIYKD